MPNTNFLLLRKPLPRVRLLKISSLNSPLWQLSREFLILIITKFKKKTKNIPSSLFVVLVDSKRLGCYFIVEGEYCRAINVLLSQKPEEAGSCHAIIKETPRRMVGNFKVGKHQGINHLVLVFY